MSNRSKGFRRLFSFILAVVLIVGSTGLEKSFAEYEDRTYTMDELSRMTTDEMIDVLSNVSYTKIIGLFDRSTATSKIYGDKERMEAVRNALVEKGKEYTAEDHKGIPTFTEFLRASYYVGYYSNDESLRYLKKRESKDKCIPAILSIQRNPNFEFGTEVQDEVIDAAGSLAGGASTNVEIVNNFTRVLEDYNNNLKEYSKNHNKENACVKIISGVRYDLDNSISGDNKKANESIWYRNIDYFIDEVIKLTELPDKEENTMIIENTSYAMITLSKYYKDSEIGRKVFTNRMKNSDYLSRTYLYAARELSSYYEGINSNGHKINYEDIKLKAKDKYYGETYTFDDGRIVIRAGDKVRKDKVLKFYWAIKEVEAQFFRSIGSDNPIELDKGRKDDSLTMIIYNSPYEYGANLTINGIETENGGIYIKEYGTLYTYERGKHDSIYTVEELVRHEYTHYLQGRYLANSPSWGKGKFYESKLTDWYEEGGAEYFTGSTRTEGVKPRSSLIGQLTYINEHDRYTLKNVMDSRYSDGLDLYNYAYMFMYYADKMDQELYEGLSQSMRADNFDEFNEIVLKLKTDENKNRDYQENMDTLIKNIDKFDVPKASDIYLNKYQDKDADEILEDIKKVTGVKDLKYELKKSDIFDTIEIEGTYDSDTSYQEKNNDRQNMSEIVDEMLLNLSDLEWAGYDTFTAYFKNCRLGDNNNLVYDLVFHGIKSSNGFELDPNDLGKVIPKIDIITDNITKSYNRFIGDGSKSENGDIVDYKWIIDGKEYSGYYTDILFNEPGEYNVKLIVTDELGIVGESETILKIAKRIELVHPEDLDDYEEGEENPKDINKLEKEPNDDHYDANFLEDIIRGETSLEDTDYFYFDILDDGYYEIILNKLNGQDCSFIIHNEYDLNTMLHYPTDMTENKLSCKQYYNIGRYYVRVYGFTSEVNEYSLEIK